MPDNIEDLFNEAIQADEAGGEKEQEEKEEENTETGDKPETDSTDEQNQEEEDNKDATEKNEDEPTNEDLSEDDEDIDDPALILQRYKTLQGMYRSQKQKLEELSKGESTKTEEGSQQNKEDKETDIPESQAQQDKIDTSWVNDALSSDEDVKEFAEEFPEIHAVLEKSLKAVMERYTQAMSQAFQTLLQQIDQKYQPIASSVTQIAEKEKDETIKSQHPDYSNLIQSQELKDWIDSQPKTLKKAYSEILENGSAEDMIEMLNDFKLKTGIKSTQESQPAPKKKPKVTPSTKNKAPSAKPPVDMDDFEQAFYEAINEGD